MYTKEPSVKTAEFNVAKKWSLVGITDPRYFLTNSGWFWIASDIGQNIIPCLVNSSLNVVATTFKDELTKQGIIFCPISEAIQNHPELVKKYLGSVIPTSDHFFATLNSAVFTDGSFVYIPEGVRCPMELSTYFRINASNTGQFERTLIIADKGSYVSYLEGCTAPMRDENQLHVIDFHLSLELYILLSNLHNCLCQL